MKTVKHSTDKSTLPALGVLPHRQKVTINGVAHSPDEVLQFAWLTALYAIAAKGELTIESLGRLQRLSPEALQSPAQ